MGLKRLRAGLRPIPAASIPSVSVGPRLEVFGTTREPADPTSPTTTQPSEAAESGAQDFVQFELVVTHSPRSR